MGYATAAMRKLGGGRGNARSGFDDAKLKKRIGWLNNEGGFDGAIRYDKIAEAAAASRASLGDAFHFLKELEEKKDEVNDPTAYVAAALRKAGSRSRQAGTSRKAGVK